MSTQYNNAMAGVMVVIVLFIFYTMATWMTPANEKYITGFWLADNDDFCEDSDIDSMMVCIGDPETSYGTVTRQCYIVVTDDVYHGAFTLKYRKKYAGMSISKYTISAEVEFEDTLTGDPEDTLWPRNVEITFDILAGTMVVTHGDMVYARLYKNHEISEC